MQVFAQRGCANQAIFKPGGMAADLSSPRWGSWKRTEDWAWQWFSVALDRGIFYGAR